MFYTFQGMMGDGTVYVAAILPVSHPSLGNDSADADIAGQIASAQTNLDEAAAESFTPGLTQLDALVSSISVR